MAGCWGFLAGYGGFFGGVGWLANAGWWGDLVGDLGRIWLATALFWKRDANRKNGNCGWVYPVSHGVAV
ncbi:MAG: hypothetical protein MJE68_23220 [Proteobacteria bacterium]|nr:hypothetical protein [Pseudomonadota bacterium]